MAKKATVTESDMTRAMKAAVKSGLTVHECIMTADQVKLIFTDKKNAVQNVDPRQPEQWD